MEKERNFRDILKLPEAEKILTLDQESYLMKILKHFNMENANIAQTPLPAGYKPAVNDWPVDAGLKKQYWFSPLPHTWY